MAFDAEGTVYIPMEDWVRFVTSHIPGGNGAQSIFGTPRLDGGELVVPYALSTGECHPEQWATKPRFIVEEAKAMVRQASINRAYEAFCEMASMSPDNDPMQVVAALKDLLDTLVKADEDTPKDD